ncbi:MAG: M23 family metallopeptidase [Planctomycetes bacterium]|nr:M23 family metallopeptidase [Planctomycetota bacterium]
MPHPLLLFCVALPGLLAHAEQALPPSAATSFAWPCEGYLRGLRGRGSFGVLVRAAGTPFDRTYHLGEDLWLPAGTPVLAIADGIVRYSAFSPTWTDARGLVHWNLGNTIVLEHAVVPAERGARAVCSFYVHLGADRRVAVGDRVRCGERVGTIGADRSEENGRYPAHLHFGLHRGPYVQIPPTLTRELRAAARSASGLRFGEHVLRGELQLTRERATGLCVRALDGGAPVVLSLLVGSTAPLDPPPDIMGWCEGYGRDPAVVREWLRPSEFLRQRGAR